LFIVDMLISIVWHFISKYSVVKFVGELNKYESDLRLSSRG